MGNNWDGTADVIQPRKFKSIARINIIPDIEERMKEIESNPERALGYFLAIRQEVGEGHDRVRGRHVSSSHNGRVLYVSRPSLADVVAINLRTKGIIWRTKVDGNRADHMAICRDGKRLLVSASTAKVIDVIDTKTGAIVAKVPSGDEPHENNFSKATASSSTTPASGRSSRRATNPALDFTKGERVFEIIDTSNWQVVRKIDMGKKLDESGEPDMSGAVRPMALSPDERYLYFQVSFFHGFVEYDLQQDRVLRLAHLPESDEAKQKRRDEYLLDSAHHGLAMNPSGTKLCAAGTMSDYAAIVTAIHSPTRSRPTATSRTRATNSGRGSDCFVSFSGDDAVSVISYRKAKEIARIQVGDHPQRMRMGKVRAACWARRSRAVHAAHAEPRSASRSARHIAQENTLADQLVSQRNA